MGYADDGMGWAYISVRPTQISLYRASTDEGAETDSGAQCVVNLFDKLTDKSSIRSNPHHRHSLVIQLAN